MHAMSRVLLLIHLVGLIPAPHAQNTHSSTFTPGGLGVVEVWASTSPFNPVQSTSFGSIAIGTFMSMSFTMTFHGRSDSVDPDKVENFFRVGFDAFEGNHCGGSLAHYPSLWISSSSEVPYMVLTEDDCVAVTTMLDGLGELTAGTTYRFDISWNSTRVTVSMENMNATADGTWSASWSHAATHGDYIGERVPVWWMSNKFSTKSYNVGNGTFFDVVITSEYATDAPTTATPTAQPTKIPTTTPTASPTAEPTAEPTVTPTAPPTESPTTSSPTAPPTTEPTTSRPTTSPSIAPTTSSPTSSPSMEPTTSRPTASPTTSAPSTSPSIPPTTSPPTTASPTATEPTAPPTAAEALKKTSTTLNVINVVDSSAAGMSPLNIAYAVIAVLVVALGCHIVFLYGRYRKRKAALIAEDGLIDIVDAEGNVHDDIPIHSPDARPPAESPEPEFDERPLERMSLPDSRRLELEDEESEFLHKRHDTMNTIGTMSNAGVLEEEDEAESSTTRALSQASSTVLQLSASSTALPSHDRRDDE